MVSKIYLFFYFVTIPAVLATKSAPKKKCIDELGCFDMGKPFYDSHQRPNSMAPDDRKEINTYFLLYTPANPVTPKKFSNIHKKKGDISKSKYNPNVNTRIVVGGFMSGGVSKWKKNMVAAFIKHTKSNVFLVDWSGGDSGYYPQAVANTRVVGAEIALFIKRLQNEVGLKSHDVHILGHSLGSHIAGYAGKRIKDLGRITGLDPAGPYFTSVEPIVRLDRNDALLVDVIHTNAAPSQYIGFGLEDSIGHFDFFPNGGKLQPGCNSTAQLLISLISFKTPSIEDINCNHVRAIELFISSIKDTNCKLWGAVCSSWKNYVNGKCGTCIDGNDGLCIPLGIDAEYFALLTKYKKDESINLFLNTTKSEPFCT